MRCRQVNIRQVATTVRVFCCLHQLSHYCAGQAGQAGALHPSISPRLRLRIPNSRALSSSHQVSPVTNPLSHPDHCFWSQSEGPGWCCGLLDDTLLLSTWSLILPLVLSLFWLHSWTSWRLIDCLWECKMEKVSIGSFMVAWVWQSLVRHSWDISISVRWYQYIHQLLLVQCTNI